MYWTIVVIPTILMLVSALRREEPNLILFILAFVWLFTGIGYDAHRQDVERQRIYKECVDKRLLHHKDELELLKKCKEYASVKWRSK